MSTNKLYALIFVLVGLLIYINSLFNSFVGDDFLQIVHNRNIQSLDNLPRIFSGSTYESGGASHITGLFYRPLMLFAFAVLHYFFSLNTAVFHLFQISIHIANSILLFLFLKSQLKPKASFTVSIFFLVHPINNEAVVYSANLQEPLFFFFGILALIFIQKKPAVLINASIASLLLFLSLLSKESGILFIALTLIYAYIFKKDFFKYLIFTHLACIVFYLILRFPIAQMHLAQGSITPLYNSPLTERLLHIPVIFLYYLKTFFFPLTLSSHHFWIIDNLTLDNFYFPLLVVSLFITVVAYFGFVIYKYNIKIFRSYIFFAIWFGTGILLHMQIYPLDMTVADRWFYFPIVGLLCMIALGAQGARIKSKNLSMAAIVCLMLIFLLFSIRTIQRNFDWRDELTLFGRDIIVTPRNFVLDNLYASALISDGQIRKAKQYVDSSIREYPYYANLNNMAIIYASEGDYKSAKMYLKKAVDSSRFYVIYENYSQFLLFYENLKEAEEFTKKALELFPVNPRLWMNLAKIYYFEGSRDKALSAAKKAYEISKSVEFSDLIYEIQYGKLEDQRRYKYLAPPASN